MRLPPDQGFHPAVRSRWTGRRQSPSVPGAQELAAGHVQCNSPEGETGMKSYLLQMAGLGLAAGAIVWSAAVTAGRNFQVAGGAADRHASPSPTRSIMRRSSISTLTESRPASSVELAGEVAKVLGAKLDIQRTPFPSMIPGLAAGRFKIAWETFSANPGSPEAGRFRDVHQGRRRRLDDAGEAVDLHRRQPALRQAHRRLGRHRLRLPRRQAERRMHRKKGLPEITEVGIQFVDGHRSGGAVRPCRRAHG